MFNRVADWNGLGVYSSQDGFVRALDPGFLPEPSVKQSRTAAKHADPSKIGMGGVLALAGVGMLLVGARPARAGANGGLRCPHCACRRDPSLAFCPGCGGK